MDNHLNTEQVLLAFSAGTGTSKDSVVSRLITVDCGEIRYVQIFTGKVHKNFEISNFLLEFLTASWKKFDILKILTEF